MDATDLTTLYNFDSFVLEKVERWLNFGQSPPIGQPAPDFPLWHLDETQTRLSELWSQHSYTIIEFGSFT